ncbi:T9SS type B sorting domain-containing protein [Neolewinella litorea]|uniref:Gliding motility-associated C-terminal domain-containing protein n=1 Tax=Neolewinella litorea TaxID=2562452 RepID=A0A4S4NJ62_9BACT|nr:gliding motility-associated C-terminal domain-containing protein [Neolewinella litorea]THH39836.1 gliding motility-associated C-terminal domain-containing protein [Neolewinella litorea]
MRTTLTLLALLLLGSLRAQIAAPDFLCTRSEAGGEILTWQNVANDCGPYLGTRIYRAEAAAGPYALLATLTDPAATEYRDENPAGLQLFYYLEYDYDCPGQEVLRSDTLDSFIPVTPEVHFVSVVDGDLVIYWDPSPSPEVNRYVILELTDSGVIPLDTVGLVTSYRLPGRSPEEDLDRRFRVAALDACGNDSPQSAIRSALGLGGTGGQGCDSEITFFPVVGRDSSGNSSDSVFQLAAGDSLQLFVSVNGGAYRPSPAVAADTVPFLTYRDANDGDSLCFYVEIDYAGRDINQRTAVFCQTVEFAQPVRDFPLYGVELGTDGRLRFAYSYPDPPPATYATQLERLGPSGPINIPEPVDSLLSQQVVFIDQAVAVAARDSFRFVLTDDCGRSGRSNYVSPVVLAAATLPTDAVELAWTPLENGLPGTLTYTVYRLSADSSATVLATGITALTFIDETPMSGELPCYVVEADFRPEGQAENFTFWSNVVCVARETEVYLPNAFSPTADQEVNRSFRPIFTDPTGLTGYQLQVYDRWGGLLFSGEDPLVGWDGSLGGQLAPAGSYVYILRFTSALGNLVQESGVVHLLY